MTALAAAGLDADSLDNLYVADYDHHRVQKFDTTGGFITKAGGLATGSLDGQFNLPFAVATSVTR